MAQDDCFESYIVAVRSDYGQSNDEFFLRLSMVMDDFD